MKVGVLNLNTEHFVIEHLLDSPVNRQLIESFVVPNNARGLESYLKSQAENDENNNSHVKPAYDRGCIFMYQGI